MEANLAGLPHVDGVEHRIVDIGELKVHVAEAGEGEPVLLLHGWPQHWYMWHEVIGLLAPRYRLIIPDLRGFGWSEAPDSRYSPEIFAADQIALLDELGIERCAAIGHDWGGLTIQLMALEHPQRLRALVVCNVPHLWPAIGLRTAIGQAPRSWYSWAAASPIGSPALRTRFLRHMLETRNVRDLFSDEELAWYIDPLMAADRAHVTKRLYRSYQGFVLGLARRRYRHRRLTVPTRVLFGKRDRYISWRVFDGARPNADQLEVELIEDSGHFIVNERPDLVAERAIELFEPG